MVPYTEITSGSWSARWGDWMIFLKDQRVNGWAVVVWRLPPGLPMSRRRRLGAASALDTAELAVTYACDLLRARGVRILVGGEAQLLEKFLSFNPAPSEEVT